MMRTAALITALGCLPALAGCGGGSGGSSGSVVRIQSTQFNPKTITINAGDRVQWTNSDSVNHQVVSGTLLPTSNPQVLTPVISINQDNTFTPATFQADLGDTVQWQNNRLSPFTMEIVNETGGVVDTLNFAQAGQIIRYSGFPNAGFYTFRQQNNALFSGTVTVFGVPNPDLRFQSQVLGPNGTFTTEFDNPGTFPYFDQNPSDPNRSFMTGTVVVR